jgi:hypothetical protein
VMRNHEHDFDSKFDVVSLYFHPLSDIPIREIRAGRLTGTRY